MLFRNPCYGLKIEKDFPVLELERIWIGADTSSSSSSRTLSELLVYKKLFQKEAGISNNTSWEDRNYTSDFTLYVLLWLLYIINSISHLSTRCFFADFSLLMKILKKNKFSNRKLIIHIAYFCSFFSNRTLLFVKSVTDVTLIPVPIYMGIAEMLWSPGHRVRDRYE